MLLDLNWVEYNKIEIVFVGDPSIPSIAYIWTPHSLVVIPLFKFNTYKLYNKY